MKKMTFVFMLFGALGVFADATSVSDVIVRQQWPWSNAVNVDFIVGNAAGKLSQVTMAAYAGSEFLGYISPAKCTGDTMITSDGQKRITFDPNGIDFLAAKGSMNNLSIDVQIRNTPDEELLYMIVDLTKSKGEEGQFSYVTEFDLTNGVYGAWERNKWGMIDTPIWTGVTANDEYKTTKLVLRRIPAGTVTMGTPSDSSLYRPTDCTPTEVTITKPYYIAVFETTSAQQSWILGAATKSTSKLPVQGIFYAYNTGTSAIRARAALGANETWPTVKEPFDSEFAVQRSIMAYFRRLTGKSFDIPTEAQWEKAARAGSTGVYYTSNAQTADSKTLGSIAKVAGSTATEVGLRLPNGYGLYDVLGNVSEFVLDWYQSGYVPSSTDPEGPNTPSSSDNFKLLKGYSYIDKVNAADSNNVHLGGRKSRSFSLNNNQDGYRICCPAN